MTEKFIRMFCRLTFFLILGLISGCVSSQNFSILENRVATLEMEGSQRVSRESKIAQGVSAAVNRVESDLEDSKRIFREDYAELKTLIEEMRAENRLLVGRLEESEYRLKTMGEQSAEEKKTDFARLDAAVSRNFQRLGALEEYMGFEPSLQDMETTTAPPGETISGDTSERGLYSTAKGLLDKDAFEPARKGFEAFLKLYPESDNADNARFWIAESYYREKWYEKAILEYQKVIENHAKGNKVPGALLKQGYAFSNLGEKANARLILKELIKKHPQSNEAGIAAKKLKTLE